MPVGNTYVKVSTLVFVSRYKIEIRKIAVEEFCRNLYACFMFFKSYAEMVFFGLKIYVNWIGGYVFMHIISLRSKHHCSVQQPESVNYYSYILSNYALRI